jgi:GT2 family glycosyltransferase
MKSAGRVAVVIVNFNGLGHVAECLSALRRQSSTDFFTLVLDNGSSDGSDSLVEREFPEAELVRSPVNLGFAAGNNKAIELCLARQGVEFVLTLNNDVVLEAGCIEALVATLDEHPGAWSCQPKMYLFEERGGTPVFNNAGITVWRDGSAFNRGINEPDAGQYDGATDIFGTCAGCSMYRASALRRTGLFDESFFAYLEDVDLAWRGRLLGYSSVLCARASCLHHHGASRTDPQRKISLLEANRVRVLVKNYAASDILLSPAFTAWRMYRLAMAAGGSGEPGALRSACVPPAVAPASRLETYMGGLGPAEMLAAVLRGWLVGLRSLPACLRRRSETRSRGAVFGAAARRIARRYSASLPEALSR